MDYHQQELRVVHQQRDILFISKSQKTRKAMIMGRLPRNTKFKTSTWIKLQWWWEIELIEKRMIWLFNIQVRCRWKKCRLERGDLQTSYSHKLWVCKSPSLVKINCINLDLLDSKWELIWVKKFHVVGQWNIDHKYQWLLHEDRDHKLREWRITDKIMKMTLR